MRDFNNEEFDDIEIIRADEYDDVQVLNEDEEDETEGGLSKTSIKTINKKCYIPFPKKSITVTFPYKITSVSWKKTNKYGAYSRNGNKIKFMKIGSNPIPLENDGKCILNVYCQDGRGNLIRYVMTCYLECF